MTTVQVLLVGAAEEPMAVITNAATTYCVVWFYVARDRKMVSAINVANHCPRTPTVVAGARTGSVYAASMPLTNAFVLEFVVVKLPHNKAIVDSYLRPRTNR